MKRIAFLTVLFVLAFAAYAYAADDSADVKVEVGTYQHWDTNGMMDDVTFTGIGTTYPWNTNWAENLNDDYVGYHTNDVNWDMTCGFTAGSLAGTLTVLVAGDSYGDPTVKLTRTAGSGNYNKTIDSWKFVLTSGNWEDLPAGDKSIGTVTLTLANIP